MEGLDSWLSDPSSGSKGVAFGKELAVVYMMCFVFMQVQAVVE